MMKRGGAIIGQGGSACVFKPAIPCQGVTAERSRSSVGKVFTRADDATNEMASVHALEDLDPDQQYFVFSTHMCAFDDYGAEPDVHKCDTESQAHGHMRYQTIMPDGGVTLKRFLQSKRNLPTDGWPLYDVLTILESVFTGVHLLIENNLVHQDVKASNIVVGKEEKVRLIDFGLLVDRLDLYRNNFMFSSNYFVNPPEYMMMRSRDRIDVLSIEDLDHGTWTHVRTKFDDNRESTFNLEHDESFQKLLRQRFNSQDVDTFQRISVDGAWHKKADIYSLGLVLVFCARLINKDDVKNPLFQYLIRGMIMPHPDDRLGIMEILQVLEKILVES